MIQSKFKPGVIFTLIFSFLLMMALVVFSIITFWHEGVNGVIAIVAVILVFAFFTVLLVRGELRTKALEVVLDEDRIIVRNYAGLGKEKVYDSKEITGYKTCYLESQDSSFEYLFLISGDKRIVRLSEFYHKNYPEFKKEIKRRYRNLGTQNFNFWRELKDGLLK